MCFHAPLRPRKINKFPFLRNTCEIKKNRQNGNPTINYFIYEFHSNRNTCPTETEFVTCYPIILPSRQRFHSAKKMIHSDQHESPTTLHCQNSCYLLERGWPPCFYGTILFPLSLLSSVINCWHQSYILSLWTEKKGLTAPRSLTNTNLIE